MTRTIRAIVNFWLRRHNPCARIKAWKQAEEAERRALARGDTRGVHRARTGKREAVHANLRGMA